MRAGVGDDFLEHFAGARVHHMPVFLFERRQIDHEAVRRNRHAIAAAFVTFFPKQFLRYQIETHERADGAHVKPLGLSVRANTFHIHRMAFLIHPGGRNAPHEFVSVIDIKDQYSVSAILEVVANAGGSDIEEFVF